MDKAIKSADDSIEAHKSGYIADIEHSRTECSWILQSRCPACFGGTRFGRSFQEYVYENHLSELTLITLFYRGGDIHVCLDGNFHHRHRRSAGNNISVYIPEYFISKTEVDNVGSRIEAQRPKRPANKTSTALDAAVDECERAYTAADGRKAKTNSEIFDDTGLMALVCQHDIPLFFANIDTPGEQQKFSISLLEKLFDNLPSSATVTVLYDVGCVLARSISLVSQVIFSLIQN